VGDLLQLRDAHEQAQLLLPWHASGTLGPDETALLEAHLAECAECRRDLAAERRLRDLYAAMPVASEPERFTIPPLRLSPRHHSPWRSVKRRLSSGWGKAAQATAAAAAAIALVVLVAPDRQDGDYQLLGSETAAQSGNAIVLFAPETPARDLRAALEQAGARLVDGPTASGAYMVQVPEDGRAEALARLRASPHVVLAEPVDAVSGA
jgi:anti-sigma factor RsiW